MSVRFTEEEYRAYLAKQGKGNEPHPALMRQRGSFRTAEKVPVLDFSEEDEAGSGKRSKYGNRRVEIDGKKFDSKHEAEVYQELRLRVINGELKCVLRQVPFELPGGIKYYADFVTLTPDMKIEGVYDAKSEITKKNRVYINKKKQMKALWGIEIKEV